MNGYGFFLVLENWFDRKVYQNDRVFWFVVVLHFVLYVLEFLGVLKIGTVGWICTVLGVFMFSWVYTNARRRASRIVRAFLWAALTFLIPPLGGIIYFVFRRRGVVVTALLPSPVAVLPVFDGPVWIFARGPVRFMMKLAFWSMGIAFLMIGLRDLF